MESWPDDAGEGMLASAMRAVAPSGEVEHFPDGSYIVRQGDPFMGLYKVQEGIIELEMSEEIYSDTEEEEVPHSTRNCLVYDSMIYPSLKESLTNLTINITCSMSAEACTPCLIRDCFVSDVSMKARV